MGVGFQFSATAPLAPDELKDYTEGGLHYRTFYRAVNFSDKWHFIAEFGYNDFGLDNDAYACVLRPEIEDGLDDILAADPSIPEGSTADIYDLEIWGGAFNSMHLTGGVQYMFLGGQDRALNPYVTAQGGIYSFGQSDTDVGFSAAVDTTGNGESDLNMSFPRLPFLRDDDRENVFGMNFGGGVELTVTDAVALLGDFRYHVAFTEDKSTSFVDIGLGVVYYLGF
jgi:hypothetical protein